MVETITIFVLAIFVGYYVVWGVTPALHMLGCSSLESRSRAWLGSTERRHPNSKPISGSAGPTKSPCT